MLLPVFFLRFMIKLALSDGIDMLTQWLPVLVIAVVCWMLSQGLSPINVQFAAEKVEFIIASSDSASANASFAFSFVVTNISNTSHVAGIPSTDTIL